MRPNRDRFLEQIDRNTGSACWHFTGFINQFGYGMFRANSPARNVFAHRMSWEVHNGAIPNGLYVLHRCDNRKCVNPAHLFLGTKSENSADMVAKGRSLKGARNHKTKLTEAQVLAIRNDSRIARVIGDEYGITHGAVWKIKTYRNWGWLKTVEKPNA